MGTCHAPACARRDWLDMEITQMRHFQPSFSAQQKREQAEVALV